LLQPLLDDSLDAKRPRMGKPAHPLSGALPLPPPPGAPRRPTRARRARLTLTARRVGHANGAGGGDLARGWHAGAVGGSAAGGSAVGSDAAGARGRRGFHQRRGRDPKPRVCWDPGPPRWGPPAPRRRPAAAAAR
jgi:hypothetical protein